jgi:hypothetical protein
MLEAMKQVTRSLAFSGFLSLAVVVLIPATVAASPTKRNETVADKLHTPAEGSAEREAILDGLRRHWQASKNPDDGKT